MQLLLEATFLARLLNKKHGAESKYKEVDHFCILEIKNNENDQLNRTS